LTGSLGLQNPAENLGRHTQVVIYLKLGKTDSARAYMRAAIRGAAPVLEEVEGYKNNFVFS
jgi:hypothetical protein